jgi:hypothetical protein
MAKVTDPVGVRGTADKVVTCARRLTVEPTVPLDGTVRKRLEDR